MNIEGLNKVTLLDYPGKVACTIFTGGCDLRCPFCHNSPLVFHPNSSPMDPDEILAFLRKRRGVLDGVAITGGEPLLQHDIADFLGLVKEMGYKIKLDTNGNHPEQLEGVVSLGLVDCVAMDIKNSPDRYAQTVGIPDFDIGNILVSKDFLMNSGIDYEFRTTAVREFHSREAFGGIADFIRGAKKYYIQNFVDSGALIQNGLHGFSADEMNEFLDIVKPAAEVTGLRGV